MQTITMTRQQLYDEIWELSVAGVARKYNLNYPKLIAKCKEENVPFPSSGYWTKKSLGKDVSDEIVELPEHETDIVELLLAGAKLEKKSVPDVAVQRKDAADGDVSKMQDEKVAKQIPSEILSVQHAEMLQTDVVTEPDYTSHVLSFLKEDERRNVLQVACRLTIREKKRLHEQLVNYKNLIKERKDKGSATGNFFDEISEESKKRAMLILDALFFAIEELGGKVNDDLSFRVRFDVVKLRIVESQDKINHELTKQEARELVEYNDKVKQNKWASRPKIRKYDYVYNGKLRIIFSDGGFIRDSASLKLEEQLGNILLTIYEKSEELRIAREKREEEQRKREAEKRRLEELRRRKDEEIQKTKALLNQAEDYRIACEIRQYIAAAIQEKHMDAELVEWVEWARKKADWYDPIIAAEDELLGRREHSKSKEEKDLDKKLSGRTGPWGW